MSTLQASSPTSTRSFASTRKTFTINIIQSEWDRIRLNDPDTGSPDFCKDLIGFIRRESYPKFVEELKKANKAVELIDTLEKVLNSQAVRSNNDFWKEVASALENACATVGQPPSSVKISGLELTSKASVSQGEIGDIWEGQHNGAAVAIKSVKVYSRSEADIILQKVCQEPVIWRRHGHPHILDFLGVWTPDEPFRLGIVSPWMAHGNINTYLKVNPGEDRIKLLYQVAKGLEFLHSQNWIHQNVKGNNVLINESREACLADFGLTSIKNAPPLSNKARSRPLSDSSRWMSPELMESTNGEQCTPTFASDVYAFGITAWEVFNGEMPFRGSKIIDVLKSVTKGDRPADTDRARSFGLTDKVWTLMEHCWHTEPEKRPQMKGVVKTLKKIAGASPQKISQIKSDGRGHRHSAKKAASTSGLSNVFGSSSSRKSHDIHRAASEHFLPLQAQGRTSQGSQSQTARPYDGSHQHATPRSQESQHRSDRSVGNEARAEPRQNEARHIAQHQPLQHKPDARNVKTDNNVQTRNHRPNNRDAIEHDEGANDADEKRLNGYDAENHTVDVPAGTGKKTLDCGCFKLTCTIQ